MSEERYVIKRNGDKVPFVFNKIEAAINKAFAAENKEIPNHLMPVVTQSIDIRYKCEGNELSVETIQDVVEDCLMTCGCYDVARSYILFREKHKDLRIIKERVDWIDHYVNSKENASSSSNTDANANVSIKNVANIDGETYKSVNREIQRYRMTKKLEQMFPEVASQYVKDLESHIIYCHDEASSPVQKNYCEAVTLYPLLLEGTGGMDGLKTSPPKNLSSFCGQLVNLVFLLSAQCKGAVAIGEFFNFFDYFCAKDFGEDYIEKADEAIASLYPKRTIREEIHQYYQQIIYSLNQPAGNRSYQSPFSNVSYYDSNYWHAIFDDFVFPDGTKPKWERVNWLQKDFMVWFNNERSKTLLTFPVESVALLSKNGDIVDKEWKEFIAEMYSKGHSFFTYISDNPNSLSSCCRLQNKIDENVFSFTNGLTGVQTGSANVITLNLSRIVQNFVRIHYNNKSYTHNYTYSQFNKEGFVEYLNEILERVCKYHIAYKTLLYEIEEKGMLNASTSGYIKMKSLYSTIGLNGINEAAEFLGLECSYNNDYKDFCNLIIGTVSEMNKKYTTPSFKFNQEFVPAESLSSKNYNYDKEDGYWVPLNRNLYNSYFYLASNPKTSVLEKFRLHGREFTEKLDGGVGCHVNLEEHLSKEHYLKLIDYAIKVGTSYFTFNIPNSQCDNCGHITKVPVDVCPVCGSRHITQWTRVIGFLRPIKDFDKERYKEALTRVYSTKDEVC